MEMEREEWVEYYCRDKNEAVAKFTHKNNIDDFLDHHWICSASSIPCIFNSLFEGIKPFETKIKARPLPKTYRAKEKLSVLQLYHVSPDGCPNLNMNSVVVCYCMTRDNKYHRTTHKVGKCPWKEKDV